MTLIAGMSVLDGVVLAGAGQLVPAALAVVAFVADAGAAALGFGNLMRLDLRPRAARLTAFGPQSRRGGCRKGDTALKPRQ